MKVEVTTKGSKFTIKFNSPTKEELYKIEEEHDEDHRNAMQIYVDKMLNRLSNGLNTGCTYNIIEEYAIGGRLSKEEDEKWTN